MIDENRLATAFASIKAAAQHCELPTYSRPAAWFLKKALKFLAAESPGIAELQQAALFASLALAAAIRAKHGPAHQDRSWGPLTRVADDKEDDDYPMSTARLSQKNVLDQMNRHGRHLASRRW